MCFAFSLICHRFSIPKTIKQFSFEHLPHNFHLRYVNVHILLYTLYMTLWDYLSLVFITCVYIYCVHHFGCPRVSSEIRITHICRIEMKTIGSRAPQLLTALIWLVWRWSLKEFSFSTSHQCTCIYSNMLYQQAIKTSSDLQVFQWEPFEGVHLISMCSQWS